MTRPDAMAPMTAILKVRSFMAVARAQQVQKYFESVSFSAIGGGWFEVGLQFAKAIFDLALNARADD
jgi:hypothetical protein